MMMDSPFDGSQTDPVPGGFLEIMLGRSYRESFTRLDHNRTVVSECFVEQG